MRTRNLHCLRRLTDIVVVILRLKIGPVIAVFCTLFVILLHQFCWWHPHESLAAFSFCQPPTSNGHKISWTNCLFFFLSFFILDVAWKRGLPRKCARFVLFRSVKKRSFILLCAFDLFFQNAGSQLCFKFLMIPVAYRFPLSLYDVSSSSGLNYLFSCSLYVRHHSQHKHA